jgi:hypothetical protein
MLFGDDAPSTDFGEVLTSMETKGLAQKSFEDSIDEARKRFEDIFAKLPHSGKDVVLLLEATIDDMWEQGWSAEEESLDMFVTDFGCVLTWSLLHEYKGIPAFRSQTELNHASIMWSDLGVEVFPFHKMLKRLSVREGESLNHFWESVRGRLTLT